MLTTSNRIQVTEVIESFYVELFKIGQEENYDQFFDVEKQKEIGINGNNIDLSIFLPKVQEIFAKNKDRFNKIELRWGMSDESGKFLYSIVGERDETDEEYDKRQASVAKVQAGRSRRLGVKIQQQQFAESLRQTAREYILDRPQD